MKIDTRIITSFLIFSLLIGLNKPFRVTGQNDSAIFNGHEYELITNYLTWAEAKEDCEVRGGHLVTISNFEENEFVSSFAAERNTIWIGFTEEANEGSWQWITGEKITYINWAPREPNNYGGIDEDYAEMGGSGRWFDNVNSDPNPYVCEWEPDFSENNANFSSLVFLFSRIFLFFIIIIILIIIRRRNG